jgi:hypothetical protein
LKKCLSGMNSNLKKINNTFEEIWIWNLNFKNEHIYVENGRQNEQK